MKVDALGFVEVRGLVAGIEAADAMLKSANVQLVRQHQVDPGFITLVVEGDLAACRAAVDAGVAAASRLGEVVSRLEIGRPDGDTELMVLKLAQHSKDQFKPVSSPVNKATPAKVPEPVKTDSPPASKEVEVVVPAPADEEKPEEKEGESRAIQAIVAFISTATKGRTWAEIVKRFPDYDGQKRELEDMVKRGELRKVGNRYSKPSK